MKPFARPKVNGTITVRRFQQPQLETTARIKKGELVEPLEDVAARVGLAPPSGKGEDDIFLADAQELAIMGQLVDQGTYYLAGGALSSQQVRQDHLPSPSVRQQRQQESAAGPPSTSTTSGGVARGDTASDAVVAWAFDARVLLHQPDNHRSPETPYRLQRAVETLQASPRAREMLPKELQHPSCLSPSSSETCPRRGSAACANRARFIPPRLATREEVLSFQDPAVYSAFVDSGAALKNLKTDVYCNEQTSSVAARLSAAAVIDAGRMVLSGARQKRSGRSGAKQPASSSEGEPALLAFCLVRPPGHHCTATRPSGFCLVNNVAIAAQQLLLQPSSPNDGASPRIAILDLDVHFGEGTAAFVDDWKAPPGDAFPLLYLSLHRYDKKAFYPFEASGATSAVGVTHPGCICNVGVDTNAHVPSLCHEVISDELVEQTMRGVFLPRLAQFEPEVVFVSLGFDAGYGDPLGKMAVEGGFASAVAALKAWCLSRCVGLVAVLEGGYNPETVAQGVLSVGCALTFPREDAVVTQLCQPQLPRVWADLRHKQERRMREWQQVRQEDGDKAGGERPALVEPSDEVLGRRHSEWCKAVVADTCAAHRRALSGAS